MDSFQPCEQRWDSADFRIVGALTASLGIHLLVSWWLADSVDLNLAPVGNRINEKTLRLKLQWLGSDKSDPAPTRDTPQPQSIGPSTLKPENNPPKHPSPPSRTSQPTNRAAPAHRPSAQVLLHSAEQVAREMARTMPDASDQDSPQDATSVSARLDRALNPKREAPGVTVREDGTTRVVTEWGYTYCIKPLEDGQIVDPGEDIRVSMYCR